jgi:hypothetical protein
MQTPMLPSGTTRVALFALLSGLERDLRNAITRVISAGTPLDAILTQAELSRARKRARLHHQDIVNDTRAVEFLDLSTELQVLDRCCNDLSDDDRKILALPGGDLDRLSKLRNTVMHGRPLDFSETAFGFEFLKRMRLVAESATAVLGDTFRIRRGPRVCCQDTFSAGTGTPREDHSQPPSP